MSNKRKSKVDTTTSSAVWTSRKRIDAKALFSSDEEEEEVEEQKGHQLNKSASSGSEDSDSEHEGKDETLGDIGKRKKRCHFGGASAYFDLETKQERKKRDEKLDKLMKSHEKKKIVSIDELAFPTDAEARELVQKFYEGNKRRKKKEKKTAACHEQQFPELYSLLKYGYSVLFHGFGSKKDLMQDFAKAVKVYEEREKIPASCVMVVNGYSPAFSLKSIVHKIVQHYLGNPSNGSVPKTVESMCAFIVDTTKEVCTREEYGNGKDTTGGWVNGVVLSGDAPVWTQDLYIFIHNIDGELLRKDSVQTGLAKLAKSPKIKFVASIDHVQAPLLWSQRQIEAFNWVWRKFDTMEPYLVETINCPSMVRPKNASSSMGVEHVLRSLTPNHLAILQILGSFQLEKNRQGMDFGALLKSCRDQMLVNNEIQLNRFLTEFKDHNLVSTRKVSGNATTFSSTSTGTATELLYIALDQSTIKEKILFCK